MLGGVRAGQDTESKPHGRPRPGRHAPGPVEGVLPPVLAPAAGPQLAGQTLH